jgi:hypothetical protein
MKKLFLLFVFTLLFISSCNTEQVEIQDNSNNKELIAKLENFNNEYSNQLLLNRSWWQTALDVVSVASADALGAWAGAQGGAALAAVAGAATGGTGAVVVEVVCAVGGGVGASWGAYCTVGGSACQNRSSSNIIINHDDKVEFVINDSKFKYIENIGTLHNELLEQVNLNQTISEKEWFKSHFTENTALVENILNSKEYNLIINDVKEISINYAESGYNYNILVDDYKQRGYLDDADAIVFTNFFEIYSKATSLEDVEYITNFYKTTILNSNLDDTKKKLFLNSFSVASQSPLFWQNF